ncbi:hypothetical protein KCU67_g16694, partial [Aureobasidium melanogenum]
MGLFRSRKNKSSGKPSTASLENHEHADESMSKNETLAAVREASVDKDAVSKLEGDADAVTPEAEDESKYPTGPKLWLLVLGLCLAIWVIALDNSIIATASKSASIDTKFTNSLKQFQKSRPNGPMR